MLLDLKFSIGTLGLATGTLFSALYGMNLKNFIEESDLGFGGVSVLCFALSAFVCVYGLAKLRKLQRVRMWGEGGMGGAALAPLGGHRSNWRADSIEPVWGGLPGEGRSERMRRLRESAAVAAASRNTKPGASNATAPVDSTAGAKEKWRTSATKNQHAEATESPAKNDGVAREQHLDPGTAKAT